MDGIDGVAAAQESRERRRVDGVSKELQTDLEETGGAHAPADAHRDLCK